MLNQPLPAQVMILFQSQSGFSLQSLFSTLQMAADRDSVLWMTLIFLVIAGLSLRLVPTGQARIRSAALLFAFALLLLFLSAVLATASLNSGATGLRWVALLLGAIAFINLFSLLLFEVALKAVNVQPPRILRDLLIALAYIGAAFYLLSRSGVSLSGLITTSAVLSAVIGFALQDTLGNIMAGMALQLEKTINVGDWVKVDQHTGRVVEIRWRYTAIETRNWDTVILPNSLMMKAQAIILGRRGGEQRFHRQWVYFNVDYRYSPTEIIANVNQTLQSETIQGVATDPPAHCILYNFEDSYCRYAVRYWLTDLAVDDPTDSLVRTKIFFALKRRNIPLSIPAQSVFVTKESESRKRRKFERDIDRRLRAIEDLELFHGLNDEERRWIAERLRVAPFARGEAMTRQGSDAHWLYIITSGSAEVRLSLENGLQKTVATLRAGNFFGEMSLMTGEKRSATVVALEDSECYRLDKEVFQEVLRRRPEIAEHISVVLAERRVGLEAIREELSAEAKAARMNEAQKDIVSRIYEFFRLRQKN